MVNYHLRVANENDKDLIFKFKLDTIVGNKDISDAENSKLKNYIEQFLTSHLSDYKIIMNKDDIIGIFCTYLFDDNAYLLDEIFLIPKYRQLGIGTSLIKEAIDNTRKDKNDLYLWVYKDNIRAIKLYENLGFTVINETETRFQMKYDK